MKKFHLCCLLLALLFLAAAPHRPLRRGKDFALFIAVENYQHWNPLKHPIGEVEKIAAELHREYAFDTLILRNPTQDQIVTALRQSAQRDYSHDDSQLLIYLSGHGDFDDLTKEGFFIPRDGKRNDAAQTSYLPFSRLQRIVESNPCRHILLAIDACYSGTFDRLVAMKGDKELTFGRPAPPGSERDRYIERELTLQSRYFVASGKKEQTPDASNFAAYFLRALRNGGRDHNVLTMDELRAELKKAQPKPHIATFSGHQDEANFLFVKNTTPAPPPETLHDARRDRADWQEAERLGTAAGYRDYLRKQSQGDFRTLAEERAEKLEAEEREINAWNAAKQSNTCEAYQTFRREHPKSAYYPLAEEKEKTLCRVAVAIPIQKLEADMVRVPGGTFSMGCKDSDGDCYDDEKPSHRVTVRDYSIGKYEVTQAQWRAVMGSDPSYNAGCDECPVEQVSWNEVQVFIQKLNTLTDKIFRLPSEAEWEYAARGGQQTRGYLFSGSNNIAEVAWYDQSQVKTLFSSPKSSHPVGAKKANELGLHDMSGNVWEWCADWYAYYVSSENASPPVSSRILRGGSFEGKPEDCRIFKRHKRKPGYQLAGIGFRLAR